MIQPVSDTPPDDGFCRSFHPDLWQVTTRFTPGLIALKGKKPALRSAGMSGLRVKY
ncbi:hypothetical protein [Paraburkholderia tropica]|uniref:hypothetical protein n=1 Tax=Paraburkholderia tropica TaxID=92647 RepID=UPI002AB663A6|nr:hypothetical protein [Paraburkholderia tropica]